MQFDVRAESLHALVSSLLTLVVSFTSRFLSVPSYVDMAELARDRELRADIQEIQQRVLEFCEALGDTQHVTGSDVLLAYLAFYNNVKQAAERAVPGTDTLAANLGRFFPKRGKAQAAESKPA